MFLHKSGFSRQKMTLIARQCDDFLRRQFITDVSVYKSKMIIFLDETGVDRRDTIRKHAYSIRGKPAKKHTLLIRGERISAISIMSEQGLLDTQVFCETIDAEKMYDFTVHCLLAHLNTFNGQNPHSVVILDNASIHHTPEVIKAIQDMGAIIHFLPPYSPDYNPIEELFSKVKSIMRALENEEIEDVETIALMAFAMISSEDCRN